MDSATLEAFVNHARSVLDDDPEMSARTAELRVTQPLLEALGWDVHGPDVVAGYPVEDEVIGFALGRGDEPSVFVETVDPSTSMGREDARRFAGLMRAAGVDWGIVLDGYRYCFVASDGGTLDYVEFPLEKLVDHLEAVSYFEREAVLERETARQAVRRRAGERLASRRDEVASDIADRLVETVGEEVRSEASDAARRWVDEFVTALRGSRSGEHGRDPAASDTSSEIGGKGTTDGPENAPSPDQSIEGGPDPQFGESPPGNRRSAPGSDGPRTETQGAPRTAEDTEYVVRFFDGGTSIGAVKASSRPEVLAQTASYLDEGRELLATVSIPWNPDENDDWAVLAHEPTHPDGSPMGAYRRLSQGYCLLTNMDEAEYREVIEGLSGEVGLRVMFQGDWADG
jgi:hypothetical protein